MASHILDTATSPAFSFFSLPLNTDIFVDGDSLDDPTGNKLLPQSVIGLSDGKLPLSGKSIKWAIQ